MSSAPWKDGGREDARDGEFTSPLGEWKLHDADLGVNLGADGVHGTRLRVLLGAQVHTASPRPHADGSALRLSKFPPGS